MLVAATLVLASSESTSRVGSKPWPAVAAYLSASASFIKPPPSKKLTPVEITNHRKNECFHCDDDFTPGHKSISTCL
jgi:hypothetical protein